MDYFYQDQFPAELALHQKYALSPTLFELVWTHCCITADAALQLIHNQLFDTSQIDQVTVLKACLLHDIGVYGCQGFEWVPGQQPSDKPYIQHVVVGAWVLQKEGYPSEIVQAALTHTATGITRDDITRLGIPLPPGDDYMPASLTTELVTYSSKFHTKQPPKFLSAEEAVKELEVYGPEHVKQFGKWYEQFGPVNLEPLKEKYQPWHIAHEAMINQYKATAV